MRTRVTVQRFTSSADAVGEPIRTWFDYCSRWAYVRHVPGSRRGERFIADQFRAEADWIFQVRYDTETKAITPKDRIVYDSRTFNIQTVRNVDDRNHIIDILGYEVQ